jgi:hypothetical protein
MYIAKTDKLYLERVIFFIAGIFILVSLTLAYFVSKYWLILAGLVGLNLIVFSLTGFCLMANILIKFGLKSNSCNCGDDCNCG